MFLRILSAARYGTPLILLLFSSQLIAVQSILLRNGSTVKGTVITQNEKNIQVKGEDGRLVTIPKKSILKVIYKEVTKEEEKKIRQEEEKKIQNIQQPQSAQEEIPVIPEVPQEPVFVPPPKPTRSRWSLVWRSAVLPGWGHIYADRKKTGWIYGGTFAVALGYSIISAEHAKSAKSSYDQATFNSALIFGNSPIGLGRFNLEGQRSEYQKDVKQYNQSLAILGTVYLVQLVHSYFTGGTWAAEETVVSADGTPVRNGFQWNAGYDRVPTSVFTSTSFANGWYGKALYGEVRYSTLF
ncbi:hypothetical protein EHO60_00845 [Leptospira fletcheri]|uniref:Uncharacterized protein n=1 Tax=Leptospira fletcheri TaxID=2484981 RepID=A0A4R9GKN3_9LEPT|nr:hypothetical protein [Leptospira fletcheri]TGK13931.1 hypothetical protein EHO60_00845 [Leptospira fletcheri]